MRPATYRDEDRPVLGVLVRDDTLIPVEDRAMEHVFGYTVANDVRVRDVQRRWHGGQWFKGKNFDSHLPMGPWVVTADEMVFRVPRLIAELSAGMTLEPGDVIITGTPEGVGMGRTPPEWLRPGDVMEMEIERIGTLRDRVALTDPDCVGAHRSARASGGT